MKTKAKGAYRRDEQGRLVDPNKLADRRRYIREYRQTFVNSIKLARGCESGNCQWVGKFTPEMLDFDHINPSTKSFSIAVKLANGGSLEPILEEIKKCQVLCSNCHRKKSALTWVKQYASPKT